MGELSCHEDLDSSILGSTGNGGIIILWFELPEGAYGHFIFLELSGFNHKVHDIDGSHGAEVPVRAELVRADWNIVGEAHNDDFIVKPVECTANLQKRRIDPFQDIRGAGLKKDGGFDGDVKAFLGQADLDGVGIPSLCLLYTSDAADE